MIAVSVILNVVPASIVNPRLPAKSIVDIVLDVEALEIALLAKELCCIPLILNVPALVVPKSSVNVYVDVSTKLKLRSSVVTFWFKRTKAS